MFSKSNEKLKSINRSINI